MVVDGLLSNVVRLLWFSEPDEFDGSDSALVQELEETVLSIGAWFAEINNSCGVFDDIAFGINSLSVAFHVELLDVRGELA